MTTLVKIQRKGQMTLPSRLRSIVGVEEGDLVEASIERGKIVLTPKLLVDRSKLPSADNEYTPEQRRFIDAHLAEGLEDIRKGRVSPKFDTVDGMLASLKAGSKARPRQKKQRSR